MYSALYRKLYAFKDAHTEKDISIIRAFFSVNWDKLVDLWCWYGRVTKPLIEVGYDIIWVDSSSELLQMAQEGGVASDHFFESDCRDFLSRNKATFTGALSLYSSIWMWTREEDYAFFSNVGEALLPWGQFLFEYENFLFHSQQQNLSKKIYYEYCEWMRLMDCSFDPLEMSLSVKNKVFENDLKDPRTWDFSLNIYTYKEIAELGKQSWLQLMWIFGRNWNRFNAYEPQLFFHFKKNV